MLFIDTGIDYKDGDGQISIYCSVKQHRFSINISSQHQLSGQTMLKVTGHTSKTHYKIQV